MKRVEEAVLAFLLLSIFIFTLGSTLYLRKIMVQSQIDWEAQLAFFGLISIMVALLISKVLSKADIDV
jgi:membrane protein implicated in regulation of membrane protease activity